MKVRSDKKHYNDRIHFVNGRRLAKKGNLYLVLERVSYSNKEFWEDYAKNEYSLTIRGQGIPHNISDPVQSFQMALDYAYYNEVWIAYATIKDLSKIENKLSLEKDIEMSFTVMTDQKVPFTTHMGIFRAGEFYQKGLKIHKDLAMELHSFAAKSMKMMYPEKIYMITQPLDVMRDIMLKHLPEGSAHVGDFTERKRLLDKKEIHEKYLQRPQDVEVMEYADKLIVIGSHGAQNLIKSITQARKSLEDYDDYAYFIEDNISAFSRNYYSRVIDSSVLKELLTTIENGEVPLEKQKQEILNIFDNWEKICKDKIRQSIDEEYDSKSEYIQKQFELYFGKDGIVKPAPFKQEKEKFTIIAPDGQELTFSLPIFYEHKHLHIHLPTVIIDLKKLADLKPIDPYPADTDNLLDESLVNDVTTIGHLCEY